MKRRILLRLALLAGLLFVGQARASSHTEGVSISCNGARVVFTEEPSGKPSAPIHVYDADSHRELGQIPCVPFSESTSKPSNKSDFYYEYLSLEDVSNDGHHLLATRTPFHVTDTVRPKNQDPPYTYYLEAWDVTKIPRLLWRKKDINFVDVHWVGKRITVLMENEIQQWDEGGRVLRHFSRPASPYTDILSPDGKLAVLSTSPPTFIETQTGRIIQKSQFKIPNEYYPDKFVIGQKNLYFWEHVLEPATPPFSPWDHFYFWRVSDGKRFDADTQNYIFSPDGSAVWDKQARRFRSIETNTLTSLPVPALFAGTSTTLQAVSDDGRVWAGWSDFGKIVWTTTGKARH